MFKRLRNRIIEWLGGYTEPVIGIPPHAVLFQPQLTTFKVENVLIQLPGAESFNKQDIEWAKEELRAKLIKAVHDSDVIEYEINKVSNDTTTVTAILKCYKSNI